MDANKATIDTAYSTDGGHSWVWSFRRGSTDCTRNYTNLWEASDAPWISFGPDGVAYLSTLTWAHFATPPPDEYLSVVHVQTSFDGGRSWSAPAFLSGRSRWPTADGRG